jgi:isochorismate synthase
VSLRAALVPIDPELRGAAERLGARSGVLQATATSTLAGFGRLGELELEALAELSVPTSASGELAAIDLPPGAAVLPRCHLALPFDPRQRGWALVPELQATFDERGAWLLAVGHGEEVEPALEQGLAQLRAERPADRSPVTVASLAELPSPDGYGELVGAAVKQIVEGLLRKVVLARSVELVAERPLDPAAVAERMAEREPSCCRYGVPLPDGGRLVGASPELLLALRGRALSSHPLAGTLPIEAANDDPAELLRSLKDLDEHRLLVEDLAESLAPFVDALEVPEHPSLVLLRSVAHLGTLLEGTLTGPDVAEPLALLAAMLPTPAVGGVPRQAAIELVDELEGSRSDFFAGAVGWFDAAGDAEVFLAIRGASLRDERCRITAGAGIVAESTPLGEAVETRSKLASVLETVAPAGSSLLSRPR